MDSTDSLFAEFSSEFERFHTSLSAVLHKSVLQEQVFIPEFSLHPTAPSFENPQIKAVVFKAKNHIIKYRKIIISSRTI